MERSPLDVTARQSFEESHDTALCLIPPSHLWGPVNVLRSLNDEKFTKWPPHVTLVYPFVKPETLPEAAGALCQLDLMPHGDDISMTLEDAGVFSHRRRCTVFIRPKSGQEQSRLSELRDRIYDFLGWPKGREYQPHLTVAQSEDAHVAWHQFLLEKARLLTPLTWHTHQLAIMIRDPVSPNRITASRPMRIWGYIDLASHSLVRDPATLATIPNLIEDTSLPYPQATFRYDEVEVSWKPLGSDTLTNADIETDPLSRLVVASYNVLAEFDWPPSSSRYSALVSSILSERALADILVLQEVTDQFLSFLLADSNIRSRYSFSTHGSPHQAGTGPLPSHLNIVVLSKFPFQWEYLSSSKRHKGFAILKFPTIQTSVSSDSHSAPLVLAACHLSKGLTDIALSTKRDEVKKLVEYLDSSFPQHPWVIAGDFNLASSSRTIEEALEKGAISEKGLECLEEIDAVVSKAGFQDTWLITRVGPGESSSTTGSHESNLGFYEGEQGATFDPTSNHLAAASTGVGGSRPQRYDRILVKKCAQLHPRGFNMFGQAMDENGGISQSFASDHWGIRCLLMLSPRDGESATQSSPSFQVGLHKAALTLGNFEELKAGLVSSGQFPTAAEAELRQEAIALLQRTLLEEDADTIDAEKRSQVQLILIPVGSFGLGVWTNLSDIDCLCVGNISTRVFFALAVQKLKKAAAEGIRILRRVMANTGTMLELEIRGIRFDLQYCAAAAIAQG
jgi:2'-5' RNA ligase/endonuclease/exonuclease/phosphatase family metal-dependent hydrolase